MILGTVPVMSTTVEGSAILRPASTMKSSPWIKGKTQNEQSISRIQRLYINRMGTLSGTCNIRVEEYPLQWVSRSYLYKPLEL